MSEMYDQKSMVIPSKEFVHRSGLHHSRLALSLAHCGASSAGRGANAALTAERLGMVSPKEFVQRRGLHHSRLALSLAHGGASSAGRGADAALTAGVTQLRHGPHSREG